jgi:hypothetical protein
MTIRKSAVSSVDSFKQTTVCFFKVCRNVLWLSTASRKGFGAGNTGAANVARTRSVRRTERSPGSQDYSHAPQRRVISDSLPSPLHHLIPISFAMMLR